MPAKDVVRDVLPSVRSNDPVTSREVSIGAIKVGNQVKRVTRGVKIIGNK